MQQLKSTAKAFKLIVNAKNSAIFAIKQHCKLLARKNGSNCIEGLLISEQYIYLGVTIDDSDSIVAYLNRLKQCSVYLCINLYHFGLNFSFE